VAADLSYSVGSGERPWTWSSPGPAPPAASPNSAWGHRPGLLRRGGSSRAGPADLCVYLDNLGDDAPSVIADLTALESLTLAGDSAMDEGRRLDDHALSMIADLPALEYLALLDGAYTEHGLQQLGRLPKLRHLHIEREGLTAPMFRFATAMPALARLSGLDEFGDDGPMPPAEVQQVRAMLPPSSSADQPAIAHPARQPRPHPPDGRLTLTAYGQHLTTRSVDLPAWELDGVGLAVPAPPPSSSGRGLPKRPARTDALRRTVVLPYGKTSAGWIESAGGGLYGWFSAGGTREPGTRSRHDRHQPRAGRAVTEATAGAGVMAMAVPVALLASPAAHQHPAASRAAYGREQSSTMST